MATKHSHLNYQKNHLYFEKTNLADIVKRFKTPFFLYHQSILEKNFDDFVFSAEKAGIPNPLVCFALKSNSNPELLRLLSKRGAGADVVSGGELQRAIDAQIPPQKIVFSGVGKTVDEINLALKLGIYSFNVESLEELKQINIQARALNQVARVAFRLNPMVSPKTHKYISTGNKTHKFGILEKDILAALKILPRLKNIKVVGLSVHIGSQLLELKATQEAIKKMCHLALKLTDLEFLDVGGGLGIDYHADDRHQMPTVLDYMELVADTIQKYYLDQRPQPGLRIVFEPGRRIMAKAGIFIMQVLRQKKSGNHLFTIVDGGMNDFVRPSLYEAYHEIFPLLQKKSKIKTTIVGPICETSDCFAHQRPLSAVTSGDYLILADTGAYGYSMGSQYNLRPRPAEILLTSDNELKIINRAQNFSDLS